MFLQLGAVLALLVPTAIGWWHARTRLRALADSIAFAEEFSAQFQRYVESVGRDNRAYAELTAQSVRMQNELGLLGVYAKYKPPHANYFISDYPIILNLLPELHRAGRDEILSSRIAPEYAISIQEVLLRHSGVLDDRRTRLAAHAYNPLKLFADGVAAIVASPVGLLRTFGIVSATSSERLTSSGLFRLLAGFAGLVSFVASVATILGAQDQLLSFLRWLRDLAR